MREQKKLTKPRSVRLGGSDFLKLQKHLDNHLHVAQTWDILCVSAIGPTRQPADGRQGDDDERVQNPHRR